MAEKILMVSYRDHLHKCHLPGDEKKEITVGNAWTDTVTFLTLEQRLPIVWDGKACIIEESMLQVNEQKTIHIDNSPMQFYLIDAMSSDVYDIAAKRSITFGANEYDDVSISGTSRSEERRVGKEGRCGWGRAK